MSLKGEFHLKKLSGRIIEGLSKADLISMSEAGMIDPRDEIRKEGHKTWHRASAVVGLTSKQKNPSKAQIPVPNSESRAGKKMIMFTSYFAIIALVIIGGGYGIWAAIKDTGLIKDSSESKNVVSEVVTRPADSRPTSPPSERSAKPQATIETPKSPRQRGGSRGGSAAQAESQNSQSESGGIATQAKNQNASKSSDASSDVHQLIQSYLDRIVESRKSLTLAIQTRDVDNFENAMSEELSALQDLSKPEINEFVISMRSENRRRELTEPIKRFKENLPGMYLPALYEFLAQSSANEQFKNNYLKNLRTTYDCLLKISEWMPRELYWQFYELIQLNFSPNHLTLPLQTPSPDMNIEAKILVPKSGPLWVHKKLGLPIIGGFSWNIRHYGDFKGGSLWSQSERNVHVPRPLIIDPLDSTSKNDFATPFYLTEKFGEPIFQPLSEYSGYKALERSPVLSFRKNNVFNLIEQLGLGCPTIQKDDRFSWRGTDPFGFINSDFFTWGERLEQGGISSWQYSYEEYTDTAGRINRVELGEGNNPYSFVFTRDDLNRVIAMERYNHRGGSDNIRYSYSYDQNGLLTAIQLTVDGEASGNIFLHYQSGLLSSIITSNQDDSVPKWKIQYFYDSQYRPTLINARMIDQLTVDSKASGNIFDKFIPTRLFKFAFTYKGNQRAWESAFIRVSEDIPPGLPGYPTEKLDPPYSSHQYLQPDLIIYSRSNVPTFDNLKDWQRFIWNTFSLKDFNAEQVQVSKDDSAELATPSNSESVKDNFPSAPQPLKDAINRLVNLLDGLEDSRNSVIADLEEYNLSRENMTVSELKLTREQLENRWDELRSSFRENYKFSGYETLYSNKDCAVWETVMGYPKIEKRGLFYTKFNEIAFNDCVEFWKNETLPAIQEKRDTLKKLASLTIDSPVDSVPSLIHSINKVEIYARLNWYRIIEPNQKDVLSRAERDSGVASWLGGPQFYGRYDERGDTLGKAKDPIRFSCANLLDEGCTSTSELSRQFRKLATNDSFDAFSINELAIWDSICEDRTIFLGTTAAEQDQIKQILSHLMTILAREPRDQEGYLEISNAAANARRQLINIVWEDSNKPRGGDSIVNLRNSIRNAQDAVKEFKKITPNTNYDNYSRSDSKTILEITAAIFGKTFYETALHLRHFINVFAPDNLTAKQYEEFQDLKSSTFTFFGGKHNFSVRRSIDYENSTFNERHFNTAMERLDFVLELLKKL